MLIEDPAERATAAQLCSATFISAYTQHNNLPHPDRAVCFFSTKLTLSQTELIANLQSLNREHTHARRALNQYERALGPFRQLALLLLPRLTFSYFLAALRSERAERAQDGGTIVAAGSSRCAITAEGSGASGRNERGEKEHEFLRYYC